MCRVVDMQQAVLAQNDRSADALRTELSLRGTSVVNLLSSPGSGKTALLEAALADAAGRDVPVAALTADLATENDAVRLGRSGVPVKQVLTDGLCHLEAHMLRSHLEDWLPEETRLLFVENVGNLVCPAGYDLGESLRVALMSVTEGEDKPLKYPSAFGLAHLVVVTKNDIAEAAGFARETFLAHVQRVNPGVEVVFTSARQGENTGVLLDRALAVHQGHPVHEPVMGRPSAEHGHGVPRTLPPHDHDHDHDHGHGHGHDDGHGHSAGTGVPHVHS